MIHNGIIQNTITELTHNHAAKYPYIPLHRQHIPSLPLINEIVASIKEVIFPGYSGVSAIEENALILHTGEHIYKVFNLLKHQILQTLLFEQRLNEANAEIRDKADEISCAFLERLPHIKAMLSTDVKAMFNSDPAAKSYSEVIFSYPSISALLNYRIAHELSLLNVPILPRIITELAHSTTGIDIHPGATIGSYFSIDHGTGVVIGQTTIIGNHVTLYQGVTLGAKSFTVDDEGHPQDVPRHPIIEDHVTIYSNSSILGRITIGHDTIIGGNIWLTYSVPPYSRILQTKAVMLNFTDGAGI